MAQRIVIKVGTSTLLDDEERPSTAFQSLARSIERLDPGVSVVLVSSGAIGFGVRALQLASRPASTSELQALSMIGQPHLMKLWRDVFADRSIGQALLTRREIDEPTSWHAFERAIQAMEKYGALVIINENDAITSEEITFGDNDCLAAHVAVKLNADALILLTDQDGIQAGFGTPSQARLSRVMMTEASQYIDVRPSHHGTGGIASKLKSADIALRGGVAAYVGLTTQPDVVRQLLAGQTGTEIVQ